MTRWFRWLMKSTQENIILLGLVLLVLLLFLGVAAAVTPPSADTEEWERTSYHVRRGDTLWGIAQEHCPDGVDYREWIDKVCEVNDLSDGWIYEGQDITILTDKGAQGRRKR